MHDTRKSVWLPSSKSPADPTDPLLSASHIAKLIPAKLSQWAAARPPIPDHL